MVDIEGVFSRECSSELFLCRMHKDDSSDKDTEISEETESDSETS